MERYEVEARQSVGRGGTAQRSSASRIQHRVPCAIGDIIDLVGGAPRNEQRIADEVLPRSTENAGRGNTVQTVHNIAGWH